MAASSNFGNMFSVVGASIFLPFLPMLPLQVLTNNLLYDFSQTTIPTDDVNREWLMKPRKWAIDEIRRFILFIGPFSLIFDYLTFFIMLYVFSTWHNPALFCTGWSVLIIIPFISALTFFPPGNVILISMFTPSSARHHYTLPHPIQQKALYM